MVGTLSSASRPDRRAAPRVLEQTSAPSELPHSCRRSTKATVVPPLPPSNARFRAFSNDGLLALAASAARAAARRVKRQAAREAQVIVRRNTSPCGSTRRSRGRSLRIGAGGGPARTPATSRHFSPPSRKRVGSTVASSSAASSSERAVGRDGGAARASPGAAAASSAAAKRPRQRDRVDRPQPGGVDARVQRLADGAAAPLAPPPSLGGGARVAATARRGRRAPCRPSRRRRASAGPRRPTRSPAETVEAEAAAGPGGPVAAAARQQRNEAAAGAVARAPQPRAGERSRTAPGLAHRPAASYDWGGGLADVLRPVGPAPRRLAPTEPLPRRRAPASPVESSDAAWGGGLRGRLAARRVGAAAHDGD